MPYPQELDGLRVVELKNHPPVAGDAKREETGEVTTQTFRVEKRMERISPKEQKKPSEFLLVFLWQPFCGDEEILVVSERNHARPRSARNAFALRKR